ncbi:hypothetical protein Ancab_033425 [Ancistrocladus abbreviatus]
MSSASAATRNDDGLLLGMQEISAAEEEEERQRGVRTLLDLLTEKMDGVDRRRGRWDSLKQRLRLKTMRCCGPASWACRSSSSPDRFSHQDDVVALQGQHERAAEQQQMAPARSSGEVHSPPIRETLSGTDCVSQVPASPSGMNLATALAAERQFRLAETDHQSENEVVGPADVSTPSPFRVSLMRLLAETADGVDDERVKVGAGIDRVCCVCMERKKGAAFIPCGHTFCRLCSRDLWLNRGTCPLCNRLILQILDIF